MERAGFHLSTRRQPTLVAFILEYLLGANPMLHDLIQERVDLEDGRIGVHDRPGLGITIGENFVERYVVR